VTQAERCGYVGQADQTSRFDRDSPGLERDVPVSRKGTFGTHLCRDLQTTILVGTEGISLVTIESTPVGSQCSCSERLFKDICFMSIWTFALFIIMRDDLLCAL